MSQRRARIPARAGTEATAPSKARPAPTVQKASTGVPGRKHARAPRAKKGGILPGMSVQKAAQASWKEDTASDVRQAQAVAAQAALQATRPRTLAPGPLRILNIRRRKIRASPKKKARHLARLHQGRKVCTAGAQKKMAAARSTAASPFLIQPETALRSRVLVPAKGAPMELRFGAFAGGESPSAKGRRLGQGLRRSRDEICPVRDEREIRKTKPVAAIRSAMGALDWTPAQQSTRNRGYSGEGCRIQAAGSSAVSGDGGRQ